ncbi:FKBP-type peptidyl-prolyl cis-trans isomerase [Pseudomonas sp. S75]|uniref:FKBP-type peptidyl-prolyl cis-trans isomerase n=1 Tax=unclassified Pseudomonas TaxID=196821 RepID=UPI001904A977|nr:MULTISPECIES: FKBP-type peptidyl-prolyl cis-trans isomerase [unclassified Pseudomonas]MBJ9977565.1 FKBP-type peptidyl-prolyl cis-trans isomerase [Pseudomonas sp. S30]MBK0155229.1 FKBP-type peptidyl-prolyl cis-trans isomerase [Pseudomonas sp. S75]
MAATPPPPASDQDLAYSLGASLGERLHQEMPDLQLEALIEGLRQAYLGQPPRIDKTRMQAIVQQHEAQAEADALQASTDRQRAAEQRFLASERGRTGTRELADGVLYSELAAGNGTQPKAGQQVQVRYVGRLPDGSVFDQSQQPQWFGLNSVIAGWQVALTQMKVGAKWRVVIPSAQAYGADGAGDLIAPYTPLVFEIELLAVRS